MPENDDPASALLRFADEAVSFIRDTLRRPSTVAQLFQSIEPPFRTHTDDDGVVHRTGQLESGRALICTFDVVEEVDTQSLVTCIACIASKERK